MKTLILIAILPMVLSCSITEKSDNNTGNQDVLVGAAQVDKYLPLLEGKAVGLVVNQTSQVNQQHIVDLLLSHGVNIKYIFAPEHGFRGDHGAGEKVSSSKDPKTGIDIISIYGKNKKPTADVMNSLDVMIFDIQDVGTRFYTYISSMHYVMQAAAESNVKFIVLDRPNPNIMYIDGPILEDEFRSFVGMHPIPILHGLTVGELAQMILGEKWLTIGLESAEQQTKDLMSRLDLTVIPVANYSRETPYSLPVPPSPNLPNDLSINLYPSLCFFEATPISIGRGTDLPFQVVGHDKINQGNFKFTPKANPHSAPYPKLEEKLATGETFTSSNVRGLELSIFMNWYQLFDKAGVEFFERPEFMDKLAGTDKIRTSILAGQTAEQIKQQWQAGLQNYLAKRKPYLIYQ
ncbi:exo-beta-N-acetylmuramidase NamZ family protein [Psychrosphaera aquimarina]